MKNDYFNLRNVSEDFYFNYRLPTYYCKILPLDFSSRILDIGCGYGQTLLALRKLGYNNLKGIDISEEAVASCASHDLCVDLISDISSYCTVQKDKFDFIIMSHVLEHIDKNEIIKTLAFIRNYLMGNDAILFIMAPNAQSSTGCYWAYEDFTHTTLFTSGSLFYVLKAAGFDKVEFIDTFGIEGSKTWTRSVRLMFLYLYKLKISFWNKVTGSSFHKPSPQIFTYELKAVAK